MSQGEWAKLVYVVWKILTTPSYLMNSRLVMTQEQEIQSAY